MLARTFGCVRVVYNYGLELRAEAYNVRGERLGYRDLSAALTALKKREDYAWLSEVSSVPLQQCLRHLERAYRSFFAGSSRYPRRKRRHDRQAAEYTRSGFRFDGEHLYLAKMAQPLPIRWSRRLRGSPSTVTVTLDRAGRYFVSLLVEEEIHTLPVARKTVGIDLGLLHAVTLSTGEKVEADRFLRRDERRLRHAQRSLARKRKGSRNREKARLHVARIHARIADRRRDFTHKLTTRLVRENQAICAESLRVKGMLRNRHLAKSIADANWGELLRQLRYKSSWYGRTFVQIDTFYPSSKQCHACGHVLDDLPLSVRFWTCPKCRSSHDRDINSAQNILAAGLAAAACGGAVRPARTSAGTLR